MASRALLFDLDGTLWDSHPLYAAVIASAGGPDPAVTQTSILNGNPTAKLLIQVGIDNRNFAAALKEHIAELEMYPSVGKSLIRLQSAGVPLGIVTSLPRWIWYPMVEITGLGENIKIIQGWQRTLRKSAAINSVLSKLSVPPNREVWYVGDLQGDGTAARTSGVSFAWASWGYSQKIPIHTDRHLRSFREVLSL